MHCPPKGSFVQKSRSKVAIALQRLRDRCRSLQIRTESASIRGAHVAQPAGAEGGGHTFKSCLVRRDTSAADSEILRAIATGRERTWPWIMMRPLDSMRPFLVRFSGPARSGHAPSWADFITTTRELEFSVHRLVTARPLCVRASLTSGQLAWPSVPTLR